MFSETPYTVTIESGNEQDRFEIVENSTQAYIDSAVEPVPIVLKNITLNGEVIILCPNITDASSVTIPTLNDKPQIFDKLSTDYALIIVKRGLDYEATSSYVLNLTVEDAKGRIGKLTVKVCLLFLEFSEK